MKKKIKDNLILAAIILGIAAVVTLFTGCKRTYQQIAEEGIREYLTKNLINPDGYEPVSYSKMDTVKSRVSKSDSCFRIKHVYFSVNSDKQKVKVYEWFSFDKEMALINPPTTINGNYGSISGNVYWLYNNYVGNKPDVGSKVMLLSLDSTNKDIKYETTTDVRGDYKIDKIVPGFYFLIVRSENTTDSPEDHIFNIMLYDDYLKTLFGFESENYKSLTKEIDRLDSLQTVALTDNSLSIYESLNKSNELERQKRDIAEEIIKTLPDNMKNTLRLRSAYGNAYNFTLQYIDEENIQGINTDFGITYN